MVKYVVHAENIRTGGGLVLLKKLSTVLPTNETLFIINSEVQNDINVKHIIIVGNSFLERFLARFSVEYPEASHLHFGNLPPIFSKSKNVSVYIQNCLLVDKWRVLRRENWRLKLRIILERIFICLFMRRKYRIIIQTSFMKKIITKRFPKNPTDLLKFSDYNFNGEKKIGRETSANVIYIGTKEAYKNFGLVYETLLNICKEHSINIKLKSTFRKETDGSFSSHYNTSLKVEWLELKSREGILDEMRSSKLLIFASKHESLGMPLLEAAYLDLDIIAADSDFVLENCRPKLLFNPDDPNSLKRVLLIYFQLNNYPNLMKDNEILKKIDS